MRMRMLLGKINLFISFAILIFCTESYCFDSLVENKKSAVGQALQYTLPRSLNITAGKGWIIIYFDGRIELKDTNLDEAAREFWHSMAMVFPDFKQNIIDEYEKKLELQNSEWKRKSNN